MSGTSMDGVDCAICQVSAAGVRLEDLWHRSFPSTLAARIRTAAAGGLDAHAVGQLHHDLGRYYARAAVPQAVGQCDLVGLHGQTVFHHPDPHAPATFQLGEPAYLAAALGVPVVANFRAADLALGGQGAPLATSFHVQVFGERGRHVAVQNLGGIGNVTSIDWCKGRTPRVVAFDTGPGNILVDLAVQRLSGGREQFDTGGRRARHGRPDLRLVRRWLRHPYFSQAPPKSTGRELWGAHWLDRAWDQFKKAGLGADDRVATLAEFTVRSVCESYRQFLTSFPTRVILAGGGARNGYFRRGIERALSEEAPGIEVVTSAQCGWPVQAVEPAAFAWLAWLRWHARPGNLPETTGARRAVPLGQIALA